MKRRDLDIIYLGALNVAEIAMCSSNGDDYKEGIVKQNEEKEGKN